MKLFKKKVTEPVLLSDSLGADADELLGQNNLIKAVTLVRDKTGLGLVDATNAVKNRQNTPA